MKQLILFSPSIVLLIMTVVVASGEISDRVLMVFLAFLTVSVAAAEIARVEFRKKR